MPIRGQTGSSPGSGTRSGHYAAHPPKPVVRLGQRTRANAGRSRTRCGEFVGRLSRAAVDWITCAGTAMRVGVVLFQLGGPDSIEAIEPFLLNLFSDPDIIDFPFARIARLPLARLIAARRAKYVACHYREIGGRSPILDHTMRQATAL